MSRSGNRVMPTSPDLQTSASKEGDASENRAPQVPRQSLPEYAWDQERLSSDPGDEKAQSSLPRHLLRSIPEGCVQRRNDGTNDWVYAGDALPRDSSVTDIVWVIGYCVVWLLLVVLIADSASNGEPARFING
jgi:hypothetical protein